MTVHTIALADLFTDDFATGLDPTYWTITNNSTRYTFNASQGDVRFSGTAGGSTAVYQRIRAIPYLTASGNFDVRVDYKDASIKRINGSPGNQVELFTFMGGVDFYLSRSDETVNGNTIHVWQNAFLGAQANTSTNGSMRITRVGTLVSGYLNSTLVYQNNYNTNDAVFRFQLQNNGTSDAIAVTFDNFYLAADRITPSPTPEAKITMLPPNKVVISWPTWATNYVLESTSTFTGSWQSVTNVPATNGNNLVVTNTMQGNARFYRLHQ